MQDPRFPELLPAQIKLLKDYGTVEDFDVETAVFTLGQKQYDFFVVLKGSVNIIDPYNDNNLIVAHQKNEFTGDSGMLSNRGSQFHGYAQPGTTLLRISPKKLKEAISKYSDISDVLLKAFLQRQETVLNEISGGPILIGSQDSKQTYALRDFMEKNHLWHNYLNIEDSEKAKELLDHFNILPDDLPVLITSQDKICKNPSIERLARESGVLMDFEDEIFDLLIIGAGPSGLAASVYAASEGLRTVTIDSNSPGGQAGKSSKIENYLGFPTGISGGELANRAYVQAQKFGCSISIPQKAESIVYNGDHFMLCVTNGREIKARAVIAATGSDYTRLPLDNIEEYEGSGVYYSATGMNIQACKNETVAIVGGGNSAGQAALFLSQHARQVLISIRGGDLGKSMSDYLVQRILSCQNIKVLYHSEITALRGTGHLETVEITVDNKPEQYHMSNLFIFIGAKPRTEWLNGLVATDKNGFIRTGLSLKQDDITRCSIYASREPQSLETSMPGFFAVGDVRHGSVKRVASAVGEGSMCISQVHQYLADIAEVVV